MKNTLPDFILIDDDLINNIIAETIIQKLLPEALIIPFTNPEKGLQYVSTHYQLPGANHAILFLDINMPLLNGWEFLDQFSCFPVEIKQHVNIFMLSSSIDFEDKRKANSNPLVQGFISKPLIEAEFKAMIPGLLKLSGSASH